MANPFAGAKGKFDLGKKLLAIQKELKNLEVEATTTDGTLTVVVNGEFRMVDIIIDESWLAPERKEELQKAILNVASQGVSKAQAVAAEQTKKIAGELNLPPGFGL